MTDRLDELMSTLAEGTLSAAEADTVDKLSRHR